MSSLEGVGRVFTNAEGELRSGWRVAVFVMLFIVAGVLIRTLGATLEILFPSLSTVLTAPDLGKPATSMELFSFTIDRAIILLAVVVATIMSVRMLERRSLASVGYKLHPGWRRDFALGCLLGLATLALAVAVEVSAGAAELGSGKQASSAVAGHIAIIITGFLISASSEELLFRGFAFQALVHNLGPAPAVVLSAGVFGALHSLNPNATPFSSANTVLAGLWLGLAYLATRSLWLATGLHYSWNLAMVSIFGLPVSGVTMFDGMSLLHGSSQAPVWLSGGTYGPEGGAAATLALVLSTLAIWKGGLFAPSPAMLDVIEHGRRAARAGTGSIGL